MESAINCHTYQLKMTKSKKWSGHGHTSQNVGAAPILLRNLDKNSALSIWLSYSFVIIGSSSLCALAVKLYYPLHPECTLGANMGMSLLRILFFSQRHKLQPVFPWFPQ